MKYYIVLLFLSYLMGSCKDSSYVELDMGKVLARSSLKEFQAEVEHVFVFTDTEGAKESITTLVLTEDNGLDKDFKKREIVSIGQFFKTLREDIQIKFEQNNFMSKNSKVQEDIAQNKEIQDSQTLLTKASLIQETSKLTKNLYSKQDFIGAIEQSKIENSYDALYYSGMSYYQLMFYSNYSGEERKEFYKKSVELLKEVAKYHESPEKKALAIFWSSNAIMINTLSSSEKSAAIQDLHRILTDPVLSKTKRYNDAIYLIASYETNKNKIGEYIQLLEKVDFDDFIWDIHLKKIISNKVAIHDLSSKK